MIKKNFCNIGDKTYDVFVLMSYFEAKTLPLLFCLWTVASLLPVTIEWHKGVVWHHRQYLKDSWKDEWKIHFICLNKCWSTHKWNVYNYFFFSISSNVLLLKISRKYHARIMRLHCPTLLTAFWSLLVCFFFHSSQIGHKWRAAFI